MNPFGFTLAHLAELACEQAVLKTSSRYQSMIDSIIADAKAGRLPICGGGSVTNYAEHMVTRSAAIAWFRGRGWALPGVLVRPRTLAEAEARIAALEAEIESISAKHRAQA